MIRKTTLFLLLCLPCALQAQESQKLWYEQPAAHWEEALPVGNGRIGAMIFGRVEDELIQLNEGTLWSGGPQQAGVNPRANAYLGVIRDLLYEGEYAGAEELCRNMQGYFTESYLPMADLHIHQSYPSADVPYHYYRDVNLANATATTRFEIKGAQYTREVFTSAPDGVMMIKIMADKPGMITVDLSLTSQLQYHIQAAADDEIVLQGKAPAHVDPSYYNPGNGRDPIQQTDDAQCNGMRFRNILKAVADGGEVKADTAGLHVKNANAVVLYFTAATSFNGMDKCPDSEGKDEKALAQQSLDQALTHTYDALKARHVADYQQYFNRVQFHLTDTLGHTINQKLPSGLRLKVYAYGNYDPGLETLFYQYGRYLLIACSRPGGTPANLQGIWNPHLRAPWSSNYTININTEMNYWPAEITNLSEMHLPLLHWIEDLSKTGAVTAKEYYHARGWVAHHNSDLWGLSNAVGNLGDGDPNWANWYMGGNWLARHLWEHYAFTGDKDFLKNEAYPVMKSAALFSIDWLIEKDGKLITSPSTSPENLFVLEDGTTHSVSEATTMDMAIIRDLFTNVIAASEVLNTDKKFRKLLIEKRSKLFPYQIGAKGQLQEWSKDFKEQDPQHRHASHLYGLHPGYSISPLTTPALARAAAQTLALRGDGGTGWSKGWKINFAARLLDGDHAYKMIREILTYVDYDARSGGGTYPNFFDAHPPFQIDGNFAATAGMTEMLLQSHLGEIHLLPALPKAWPDGEITGLKARGNFTVDIRWENGTLAEARITSVLGNPCVIRTSVPIQVSGATSSQTSDGRYFVTTVTLKKSGSIIITPQP